MTIKQIKIVDKAKKNEEELFGIGRERDEFYFVRPGLRTAHDFNMIRRRLERGYPFFAYVETSGRQAILINPGDADNVFREHAVTLDYKNTPPKGITIEPWNGAGDLFDVEYVAKKRDFKLSHPIPPEFVSLVNSWDWVMNNDSRDVFYEYCARSPPVKVIKEGPIPCFSVIDQSDAPLRERILRQTMDDKIDTIARLAITEKVDLVLIGLFTEDNHTHRGGRIEDLCTVDEQGLDVVNKLRDEGYTGNIVALRSAPYVLPDTFFNRTALYSLYKRGVILSPSTKQQMLTKILTGGSFISDYRLDGTPAEIDMYREINRLNGLQPVREI